MIQHLNVTAYYSNETKNKVMVAILNFPNNGQVKTNIIKGKSLFLPNNKFGFYFFVSFSRQSDFSLVEARINNKKKCNRCSFPGVAKDSNSLVTTVNCFGTIKDVDSLAQHKD